MKKILVLFLTLMCCTTLIGCQINKNTELVYESLSDKEEYLFNLTGNRILMYKLKNIPNDKKYNLSIIYEVYENGEKVKEDLIAGIMHDNIGIDSDSDIKTLGINIKNDQIRCIIANKGAIASGVYEVKEDLGRCSNAALTKNAKLTLGTEIYIYYANSTSSISGNLPLGVPIDSEVTKEILKGSQSTVLIKLSFKEI